MNVYRFRVFVKVREDENSREGKSLPAGRKNDQAAAPFVHRILPPGGQGDSHFEYVDVVTYSYRKAPPHTTHAYT